MHFAILPPPSTDWRSQLSRAKNIKMPNRSEPCASEAHRVHGKLVRPGAASSLPLFVKSDFQRGNNWQDGAFEKAEGFLIFAYAKVLSENIVTHLSLF